MDIASRSAPPRLATLAVAVLALPMLLAGCRSTVPIGDLLADPGEYDGETVRVEGRTTGGAGLMGRAAYEVDDGTGSLPVVSERSGAPAEGTVVTVVGEFRALFTLGDEGVSVLLEESRETRPGEEPSDPDEPEAPAGDGPPGR